MRILDWLRPPRAVLTLFMALVAVCAFALGWLGWQVIEQDRAMDARRIRDRLESAADRAAAAIDRALDSGDVQVTVSPGGVEVTPEGALAYVPSVPATAPVNDRFAAAENLEYAGNGIAQAAETYRDLAASGDARVRAAALVRLARVQRKQNDRAAALQTYAALETLGATAVEGMPASLIARSARASLRQDPREAALLRHDLARGAWKLDRATLESYLAELESPADLPADWSDRMALAEAAEWAYGSGAARGRGGRLAQGVPVSILWEQEGPVWRARLKRPADWRALWERLGTEMGVALRVAAIDGTALYGAPGNGPAAVRPAAVTGLPWNLAVAPSSPEQSTESGRARRRLLTAGLAVFATLLAGGSFIIGRAINRELALARLQSDFVAAVSHEFRTPLTSIRQLTEMLARGRMDNEPQKQRAYDLMMGESDRLRRLVESLLDLGRMQAGSYQFRFESVEPAEWVVGVAAEFQETVRPHGYDVRVSAADAGVRIRADREALAGALWNLLDNAVKYSPENKTVDIALACSAKSVEVTVRDSGIGIDRRELRRVFDRFYRGRNAKDGGAKGTGIGLAMVKEIVEAHGGTLRASSELGRGSEFTMVLPCEES